MADLNVNFIKIYSKKSSLIIYDHRKRISSKKTDIKIQRKLSNNLSSKAIRVINKILQLKLQVLEYKILILRHQKSPITT